MKKLKKFLIPKIDLNLNNIFESIQNYLIINKIENSFKAKLLRIQANWKYSLYNSKTSSPESLIHVCELFEMSKNLVENDSRTWSGWAYVSSRAISHFPELRPKFVIQAINGFLKATKLSPSESLEFLCQLFSIFFRYGEEISTSLISLEKELLELPSENIIQIIPQIVVHISHNDFNIKNLVQKIVLNFGKKHFQGVVFPLNVLSLINDQFKSEISNEILIKLSQIHPFQYNDSNLFIDGLHRSAVSMCEYCLLFLESASKANQNNDSITSNNFLIKFFEIINNSKCEMDLAFIRQFGNEINKSQLIFNRCKISDINTNRILWDSLKYLYSLFDEFMKKIEFIKLEKVSSKLSDKKGFTLSIPGTYTVNEKNILLYSIDPYLSVLKTQQHPRCVFMEDEFKKRWKFLLKGNEDLRLDQRIIQFFSLVNSLLKSNRSTSNLGVSISEYSIIPFAPNSGLISWVTGADTYQQLVTEYRNNKNIKQSIENDISNQFVGNLFNNLSTLQKFEIFNIISNETNANELREMLWLRSPSAIQWLERNKIFTLSTALMSISGYIIGLGDRHPSNIMIQRHTGKVIHIDFGDSFEVAMNRPLFPERVPFRLTRMIINALDSSSIEGLFRKSNENIFYVLRENQSSLIALLEVFIHEPIFYGKEIQPTNKAQKNILERVSNKLSGTDNCEFELDVPKQVDWLLSIASDPKEYIKHYVGWCPFW